VGLACLLSSCTPPLAIQILDGVGGEEDAASDEALAGEDGERGDVVRLLLELGCYADARGGDELIAAPRNGELGEDAVEIVESHMHSDWLKVELLAHVDDESDEELAVLHVVVLGVVLCESSSEQLTGGCEARTKRSCVSNTFRAQQCCPKL